jgi:YidC/Oxa1 family membrane protein insertase
MQGILLTKADGFIMGPISRVLGVIMNAIFNVLDFIGIPNIGLSIILFTIIMYLVMLPLTYKQQKFSKLSAKINPELKEIQKKYVGKRDEVSMVKQQEETKALYDKYGVSQTGSCLQLLITLPIMFALYRVIYAIPAYVTKLKNVYLGLVNKLMHLDGAAEVVSSFTNSARFASQFTDEQFVNGSTEFIQNTYIDCLNMASSTEWASLGEKFPSIATDVEQTYSVIAKYNSFLGLNIGDSPTAIISDSFANGTYWLILVAFMIPVLAGLTQWLNVKLAPGLDNGERGKNKKADQVSNTMSTMNTLMPLMSAWFCFSFPCGIGIYWIMGAVVRGVQQVLINKHIDKTMNLDELVAKNKEKAAEKAEKRSKKNLQLLEQAELIKKQNVIVTKQIDKDAVAQKAPKMNASEREAKMKEVEKYNKSSKNTTKGSLASKANMVKDFNESKKN